MNNALRGQYLAAFGLESWTLRRSPAVDLPQHAPGPGTLLPEPASVVNCR